MKKNFKHHIVHPFKDSVETQIEEMEQIEVTLSICTLWKGQPHGLATIQYKDPNDDDYSFTGVGVFNHGKLHDTSFTCFSEAEGEGFAFTNMQNGKPADGSYLTQFREDGKTQQVDSKETWTDVSGWQSYSGQVNREKVWHGKGKVWYLDGDIYFGRFENY